MTPHHTPGPWSIRDYKNKTSGVWIDCNAFANKGKGRCLGGTVCDVYDCGDDQTQKANARLIAAAPDMRESLQSLVGWCREHTSPTDTNTPHELLIKACAALGKATT